MKRDIEKQKKKERKELEKETEEQTRYLNLSDREKVWEKMKIKDFINVELAQQLLITWYWMMKVFMINISRFYIAESTCC